MRSLIFAIFSVLAISVCGNWNGNRGGGGQGRPGRFPAFLQNVTNEGRRDYFAITNNRTITFAAQNQAVQAWGQQNRVAAQVTQYQANVTASKNELNQNITQLISQLTAGQQQLNQIIQNQNQTPVQLQQALMNFRNQSRNVYQTLTYMSGLFSKGNRGPRGGMGGGFNGNFNGGGFNAGFNGRGSDNIHRGDFNGRGDFNNREGQGFASFNGPQGGYNGF